jgi:hypothetical protein
MRLHNSGKGIWILNGLAVRIAQSLGLHRNGENLGLSPFQSEIRRRIWWHLLARDSRAAEDYGLHKLCNLRSDAELPLNIEDSDLYEDMPDLPRSRPAFTAMTFPFVSYEIARAVHELAGIQAASTPATLPSESQRRQILGQAKESTDRWLKYCNPVVPRQRLALLMSRLALRKADLVSRQQWAASKKPGSNNVFGTDGDLLDAIEVLELALQLRSDETLMPFSWMWTANPEYHATMFLLWLLCMRPRGPHVERAWYVVNALVEVDELFRKPSGSMGSMVIALKSKAENIRSLSHADNGVDHASESGTLHPPLPSSSEQSEPWIENERLEWLSTSDGIGDWGSFLGTFSLGCQDFAGMLY